MNTYYVAGLPCSDELYHHGILGQKWGVRRFQNPDGSLTTAGRARYNVGTVARKVRTKAGNAARSATSYVKRRAKMKHPSLMTDDELRTYTQRLIAEKNYSDALARAQSATGFGRAEKFVGDVVTALPKAAAKGLAGIPQGTIDTLNRGLNTIADAGFRKLAQKLTQTKSEREIERLQNKLKKQQLNDSLENNEQEREQQRQIDMLTRQNRINELQDQLSNRDSTTQAERNEIERLKRQRELRDLRESINRPRSNIDITNAMQVLQNPHLFSVEDREKAVSMLERYNKATKALQNITGSDSPFAGLITMPTTTGTPAPASGTSASSTGPAPASGTSASSAGPAPAPAPEFPSSYTPNTAPRPNTQNFSRYYMRPLDETDSGMYGGRLRGPSMPSVEDMERGYYPPSTAGSTSGIQSSYTPNTAPRQNTQDGSGMYGGRLRGSSMPSVEDMERIAPMNGADRGMYDGRLRGPSMPSVEDMERRYY